MTSTIVCHPLNAEDAAPHNGRMARKARPHPKPTRRPTFIRAWRKDRGLSLVQLADRLQTELEIEIDPSQLSRIERGESPYSQDNLEALAAVLRCEPADLLMREPKKPDATEMFHSIWDRVPPLAKKQALVVLEAFAAAKTGTDD